MRRLKAILRQTVDIIFLLVTVGFFISFLFEYTDSSYWLAACILYITGNIWAKANLSIWLEDKNLTK